MTWFLNWILKNAAKTSLTLKIWWSLFPRKRSFSSPRFAVNKNDVRTLLWSGPPWYALRRIALKERLYETFEIPYTKIMKKTHFCYFRFLNDEVLSEKRFIHLTNFLRRIWPILSRLTYTYMVTCKEYVLPYSYSSFCCHFHKWCLEVKV